MHIISASRRTDIPGFYMTWLINRLKAGSVTYPNPFSRKLHTLSLKPDDVHSIVFWSKHYGPFLDSIDELTARDIHFYCHYTITGAPRALEPHVPDWQHSIEVFRRLADRTSPQRVQWRFDPILFTRDHQADFYRDRFEHIAAGLAGTTRRCYFSFASFYGKVTRRVQQVGAYDPPLEEKQALVTEIAAIAAAYNITLYACCQDFLVDKRVQKAHCVDGDLLAELFPDRPPITALNPTREQCGCTLSRDIGMYDTCGYGCIYCYANQSHARAISRLRHHDPLSPVLIPDDTSERHEG